MRSRRVTASARTAANVTAIALVGLLGLTACTSQPGHRRVVQDMIDSLELPTAQDQCMRDALGDYSNEQLEQIADENDALNFEQEGAVATGTDQYQEFVANLRSCVDGATASSVPSASTEPGGTTEVTGPTEVRGTTEATGTTEVTRTTDVSETTGASATTDV